MSNPFRLFLFGALLSTLVSVRPAPGQIVPAVVPNREEAIVDSAATVLGEIMNIPGRAIPASLLAKAEAIAIIPGMLKGGFIIGIKHGQGVLVTRDEAGAWKAPVFLKISGGSVGWQVGVQDTDLVLVFRTKTSLANLMRGNFTIGATASAAAGPVGREAEAATDVRLKAEIYSYSRSRGLFAGVALDGAVLSPDPAATNVYYQPVGGLPNQPGTAGTAGVQNPLPVSAARLLEQLARYTATTVPAPGAPNAAAAPVPADAQSLGRQLVASWQQLGAILDAPWRTYLALPTEIYSGDRVPSPEALRVTLDRFAQVAANAQYQSLTQRSEFQATWSLLRQYSAAVATPPAQPLSLPPPPN